MSVITQPRIAFRCLLGKLDTFQGGLLINQSVIYNALCHPAQPLILRASILYICSSSFLLGAKLLRLKRFSTQP